MDMKIFFYIFTVNSIRLKNHLEKNNSESDPIDIIPLCYLDSCGH